MDYSNFTIFYADFLYLKLIFDYRFLIFVAYGEILWYN